MNQPIPAVSTQWSGTLGTDTCEGKLFLVDAVDNRDVLSSLSAAEARAVAAMLTRAADALDGTAPDLPRDAQPADGCPAWCTDHQYDETDPADPGCHERIYFSTADVHVTLEADALGGDEPGANVYSRGSNQMTAEQLENLRAALALAAADLRRFGASS